MVRMMIIAPGWAGDPPIRVAVRAIASGRRVGARAVARRQKTTLHEQMNRYSPPRLIVGMSALWCHSFGYSAGRGSHCTLWPWAPTSWVQSSFARELSSEVLMCSHRCKLRDTRYRDGLHVWIHALQCVVRIMAGGRQAVITRKSRVVTCFFSPPARAPLQTSRATVNRTKPALVPLGCPP